MRKMWNILEGENKKKKKNKRRQKMMPDHPFIVGFTTTIRERKKFNQIPYVSSQKSNFHNKKFKTKKATPLVLILFLGYFTAVFGKF